MERARRIIFWRRLDVAGLERLVLGMDGDSVSAESDLICVEDGGFRLRHHWRLSRDWRALALTVEKWGPAGHARLALERTHGGWLVDGEGRADLDGTEEPDLSVTPFCNTLPIRRMQAGGRRSLTLDTCYVDAATMSVARSRQRYDRLGPGRHLYVDLGFAAGFEAELEVDDLGLVTRYGHLFERTRPAPEPA